MYTCKILLFYKIIYKYVEEKQLLGEKKKNMVDRETSVQDLSR